MNAVIIIIALVKFLSKDKDLAKVVGHITTQLNHVGAKRWHELDVIFASGCGPLKVKRSHEDAVYTIVMTIVQYLLEVGTEEAIWLAHTLDANVGLAVDMAEKLDNVVFASGNLEEILQEEVTC